MIAQLRKEEIYLEYYDKVFGYIYSRINNRTDAEDITSDVFVKVYEKLETYDESKASLSTWVYNITKNTLTDHYRTFRPFDEIPDSLEDGSSVEDEVCNSETLGHLAEALETLDERERNIIILRYYSGMTLKDISEKLGISYTYVKILHAKALNILKGFFENQ